MITQNDITPLNSDIESINTAINKLDRLARNLQMLDADSFDTELDMINYYTDMQNAQPDVIEQLRTLESYASDVRRKCQLLLVQAEEGAALSAQELKLLNELMEN